MKIASFPALAALALALCVSTTSAHECKVVCDAAHASPVCGSDGKTYASACFLEFAKCDTPTLTLAHDRACTKNKTTSSTKTIRISVITDRAKTADEEEDESEEEDKCDKGCPRNLNMLCASNGKTYNNECLFEIAHCRDAKLTVVDADGPCPDKCDKECTRELEQVCASNGKTYNNKCLFENAKCSNSSLTIVDADGPCSKK